MASMPLRPGDAAPRRHAPRGQSRGPGLARRLSRSQSGPDRPVPRPALPLLPSPARAAGHHAGQAQGARRGDDGGGQHPAGAGAALLQVPPRTRAAHRGSRGGDASVVRGAGRDGRREGIGSLVGRGEAHDGSAARDEDRSHRRAARAAESLCGDGDPEQEGRVRADRDRPADRARARHPDDRALPHRPGGIIRWQHIECAERLEDLSKFPSDDEILRAARSL